MRERFLEFARRLGGLIARAMPVRTALLRGGRAVASITFDDFPKTAWTNGGPILARHGARATFYTAGSFCGRTQDGTDFYGGEDLRAIHGAGHEIACHGFAHEPTTALSDSALTADLTRNAEFLMPFLNGAAPASYAFPFGTVSLRTKRHIAGRFSSARGVHPGINAGRVDLAQLHSVSLERYRWSDDGIAGAIARAKQAKGWIVFSTHEICDNASRYGSTPAMLEKVLKKLAESRIEVLPVREALSVALGGTS